MTRIASGAAAWTRRWLGRRGYQLIRKKSGAPDRHRADLTSGTPAPAGSEALRADNPRLLALRDRYQKLDSPLAQHTMWVETYRRVDLDLSRFRSDNIYLWQLRNVTQAKSKYFLYGRYVRSLDSRSLLDRLKEDGLFGCLTFSYETLPPLSRDLLDSINEIYFLDREIGIFDRAELRVLDIGAGYGRLAHRMHAALPNLARYYCVDAVPESTFLCEFYTEFRECGSKVTVVPLDEFHDSLSPGDIDLAVNIHSFSETSFSVIDAWLDELRRLRVRRLLIVPNDADALLSWESDGSRRDYAPLLNAHGYHLRRCEPTIRDEDVRDLIDSKDHFLLYELVGDAG